MPPQNIPLWHKDHCELKTNEKKQIQEKLTALSLFAYKAGHTKDIIHLKSPPPTTKKGKD